MFLYFWSLSVCIVQFFTGWLNFHSSLPDWSLRCRFLGCHSRSQRLDTRLLSVHTVTGWKGNWQVNHIRIGCHSLYQALSSNVVMSFSPNTNIIRNANTVKTTKARNDALHWYVSVYSYYFFFMIISCTFQTSDIFRSYYTILDIGVMQRSINKSFGCKKNVSYYFYTLLSASTHHRQ